MFLVQKRLFCLLSCNKSNIHLSSYQLCSLCSFSTASEHSSNHRSNFTLVDPLESCALSSKEAAKRANGRICEKKLSSSSPSIEFFKQSGWSDAQVMKLTQRKPKLIFANVETALKPRMRSFQDMGFSDTEIVQLVSSCPGLLYLRDIQPRINFWRSLLGSNERLIKASRRNMFLLTSSLTQKIEPNISLLRECGISEQRITQMLVAIPSFFCRTNKYINESIKHVEELGVSRDCKMFPRALLTVVSLSRSRFDATTASLMSFGWSQPDSIAAFRRHPVIWNYSKKNLSDKMTFLMEEAGCELTYIICRSVLLTYSLEKRLRPRYEVINFLDQNKLLDKGRNLLSVMVLSEEKFRNKFLFLLSKEKFIAQYDSYVDAVQGKHLVVESGWSDAQVMKLMQREPRFLRANVETILKPRMRSLQDMGFSDTEIVQLVSSCPNMLDLRDIQPRINFWRSLLGSNERSKFDATFATLMSFGWSQTDTLAAFRRHPFIWNYAKNLSDKMTFLMKEAGCELTYIIGHPVLLTYSVEKRLRPRYEVMNFLDQNKLLDKGYNLLSVMLLSEEKFRNKFLFLLCKEKFIAQYDSYVVAVQGKHNVVVEN
ncbi:hypothetical protein C4D60_Mb10t00950 [Musa balbisiana]|uniref:Uncharacterized protein n=1 Tax=Musa balbisiana TaxID=52838 RepID=A0A4S8IUL1_MUSBA|nr:hypothetical protein C4D60_Mb10t00950 [Musa balbisiana]